MLLSCKQSAKAFLSILSLSKIPQVDCIKESSKQSPAERFHNAYSLEHNPSQTSDDQLITGGTSSISNSCWTLRSSSSSSSCLWTGLGSSSISRSWKIFFTI